MPDQPTQHEPDAVEQVAAEEQRLMLSNPTVAQALTGYLQHRNIQLALRVRELEAAAGSPEGASE